MYYYFASSLPLLLPDAAPPQPLEEWRAACAQHLSPADFAALEDLLDAPERAGSDFARRWRTAATLLGNAIARARASRLKRDADRYLQAADGADSGLESQVQDAFGRRNPLERERALDAIRWRQMEELAGLNPFARDAIFAYGLKLRLLERRAARDAEAGAETVAKLVGREPDGKDRAA